MITRAAIQSARHTLCAVVLALCPAFAASASDATNLPGILSLGRALELADPAHPDIQRSRAALERSRAVELELGAKTGLRANLTGDLRTVDKISEPGHDFVDDSRLILVVDKPLGRFGAISDEREALDLGVQARQQALAAEKANQRIDIIRAFLEVIVADYAYLALDEENTLAYLAFDDARDDMERFSELAELDVRALEAVYLDAYARRTAASSARRASRFRLALALNQPDAYPDQLLEPDLAGYERPLPDFEALVALALEQNQGILAARLALESARGSLALLSRNERPTVGLRFQAAEYAETFSGSRDQFRASLYLDVPLVNGARRSGEVALQNAEVLEREANLGSLEHRVRGDLLALDHELVYLERERAAAEAELLAAELKLDKVRLEYEMELKARIGSANWDVARALHRLMKTRYQHALAWEQIDALTGQTPVSFKSE